MNTAFTHPAQRVILSSAVILAMLSSLPAIAQVGPQPPQQPPAQSGPTPDKIKDSFKKFFKPEAKAESTPADGSSLQQAPAPQPQAPSHPPLLNQPPLRQAKIEDPVVDPKSPPIKRVKVDDPNNPLGLKAASNKLDKANALVAQGKLFEAKMLLEPLRQWLIDATESHISLYKTLNQLPTARAQAELEKQVALEFAMLRDQSIMQLGKLYVADKDYRKAVIELTEVVKSQPKSKMGITAYETLQQIGFTEKLHLAE
ncbi:MAG: hypothetical protein AB7P76_05005 [Candidatus Melainabacteria bacterium]